MLPSSIPSSRNLSRLALPLTLLIFIFYFTLSPTRSSSHLSSFSSLSISPFSSSSKRKSASLASLSALEIDGPFNNASLVELCASKQWVEGLVFKCAVRVGGEDSGEGVVEARNVVLNCLRFGIEAGGAFSSSLSPPAVHLFKSS